MYICICICICICTCICICICICKCKCKCICVCSIIKLIREWISDDDPAGGFNIQPNSGWWSPMTKIFQGVQPPTNTHSSIVTSICSLQINTWLGWVGDTVGYSNGIDIGAVFQPLGAGSYYPLVIKHGNGKSTIIWFDDFPIKTVQFKSYVGDFWPSHVVLPESSWGWVKVHVADITWDTKRDMLNSQTQRGAMQRYAKRTDWWFQTCWCFILRISWCLYNHPKKSRQVIPY